MDNTLSDCMQEILEVLGKFYPQHFDAVRHTLPNLQALGALMQLINQLPVIPQGNTSGGQCESAG